MSAMLSNIDITKILFLDVECVSGQPTYDDLDETFQELWAHKSQGILRKTVPEPTSDDIAACYKEKAGIYAEFGKIICISVGLLTRDANKNLVVRLKSFADHDEKELLKAFCSLLDQYYNNPTYHFLCGHNIKEFDIPYI